MHPPMFWKQHPTDGAAGAPLTVASATVTPFAMCGQVFGSDRSLLRSACDLDPKLSREFFSCLLFQVIVQFKWEAFGKRRCIFRLLRYSAFQALLFLLSSSFATETQPGTRWIAVFACVASILPLAYEIHHIVHHAVASARKNTAAAVRRAATGSTWFSRFLNSRYLRDFWNAFDLARVIFTTASLAAVAANDRTNSAWLLAITLYLRWLGFLFFLMPFESVGPLIRMILQIARGIRCMPPCCRFIFQNVCVYVSSRDHVI
jgi:hypothetical protein